MIQIIYSSIILYARITITKKYRNTFTNEIHAYIIIGILIGFKYNVNEYTNSYVVTVHLYHELYGFG